MNSPSHESSRRAVVLSLDRLPVRLLGCYGSGMCQTPHLDRLAAAAWTFDSHFADDIRGARGAHSWWTGGNTGENSVVLGRALGEAGVRTTLLVDDPYSETIAEGGFEQQLTAAPAGEEAELLPPLLDRAAEVIAQNQSEAEGDWLLWVHTSELPRLPVPPMDILELYLDELVSEPDEDGGSAGGLSSDQRAEALGRIGETMERLQDDLADLGAADVRVLNVLAAAAVSAIDRAIGTFLSRLKGSEEVLFVLTADRGLSLGEERVASRINPHRRGCPIADETVHTPLIIRPGTGVAAERFSALSQPVDLAATLYDWFGLGTEFGSGASLLPIARGERDRIRECAVTRGDEWNAIRDEEWLYLRSEHGDEQLFVLPEDRHQVLDVLAQEIDEADRLHGLLRAAVR